MTLFRDRRDAGRQLATRLLEQTDVKPDSAVSPSTDLIVLGIPRGGVIVADEIARALDAPMDVFITRKLGAPSNSELAIGAVTSDGTVFLDKSLVQHLHISQQSIDRERDAQLREIERRLEMYRRGRLPLMLRGKTVILVDDGIATGATTIAALRALQRHQPRRVILAVPVAPRQVLAQLRQEADQLVILDSPDPFVAVGYFYRNFEQVSDEEVMAILRQEDGER